MECLHVGSGLCVLAEYVIAMACEMNSVVQTIMFVRMPTQITGSNEKMMEMRVRARDALQCIFSLGSAAVWPGRSLLTCINWSNREHASWKPLYDVPYNAERMELLFGEHKFSSLKFPSIR